MGVELIMCEDKMSRIVPLQFIMLTQGDEIMVRGWGGDKRALRSGLRGWL